MNTKLYVGNLPYSVTESALRELFAPAGEIVSVAIITDRDTGRPRGFAFVEMADAASAQKAITLVNGKTLDDRQLTVNEAKPQPARYGSGGGGGGGGFSRGGRR
jgi:RNA recognition motif-containing protein